IGGAAWFAPFDSSGDSSGGSSGGSSGEGAAYVYAGILALTGGAALGGGIYGTFASLFKRVPRKRMKKAKAAIKRALEDSDPVRMLNAEFRKLALARKDVKLVVLDGEKIKSGPRGELLDPIEGVDSVLVVRVGHAGLTGKKGLNPDLWVLLSLSCMVSTKKLPWGGYSRRGGYDNKKTPRKFIDWGADDAKLLREEFGHAYPFVAESALKAVLDPKGVRVLVPAPTGT
ncbi:hypothetical protein ACFL2T_07310, partial [Elusimicrobiota bacterium]